MFHEPATKEEAKTYRYGKWIGNPRGVAFDQCRCAAEVSDGWRFRQCAKKPGSGHDGIYCKTHAKMLKAANVQIEAPSRPIAEVASNAGLGVAVPPAPTFENRKD